MVFDPRIVFPKRKAWVCSNPDYRRCGKIWYEKPAYDVCTNWQCRHPIKEIEIPD